MTKSKTAPDPEHLLRNLEHRRPVTRRDFLSRGLIGGVGMVTLPTFAQMLMPRTAQAQLGCTLSAAGGTVPFICIDLAGGANIAGSNAIVGGLGGQLDFISAAGYRKMGLPPDQAPNLAGQLNQDLGIAMHSDSAFLRGIQDKASITTQANVNGSIICARSDNDTGTNPHNPMYGINRAGASGDLVALIGTESSVSGGNSDSPMDTVDPSVRPTKVDRPSDARGLVDTGRLVELLSQADAAEVMSTVEQLSAMKLDRVAEDDALKQQILCGYVKTTDQVSRFGDPDQLDPLFDPIITGAVDSIFDAGEMDQSDFRKTASVMKLVMNQLAGAGTIELGGFDYHDGTRATGEDRDFSAGQCMGAVLEYASRLPVPTPVMIYVLSDGSVSSDGQVDNSGAGRGKGVWRGDNSSTAASMFLVYDPAGRPAMRTPTANQIGYFRDSGDVETDANRVADEVNLLTQSVVLNYLALHGRQGEIGTVLPGHGLGSVADRDALTAFTQIV